MLFSHAYHMAPNQNTTTTIGYRALAIDLVPVAIQEGRRLEEAARAPDSDGVEWVTGDMFTALPMVRLLWFYFQRVLRLGVYCPNVSPRP